MRRAHLSTRALAAVGAAAAWAVLAVAPAAAQGGERIERYEVEATVEDDGDLLVREAITYDFAGAERHGIERLIPVRERFDDTYDRVVPLEVVDVSATGGASAEWEREPSGDHERIRVGDPDETISGVHTYELTYRLEAVLNGFDDRVELYWQAIGGESGVPVETARVRVELPADPERVLCFTGPVGSTQPCAEAVGGTREATFAADALEPGDTVTVVVALPAGVVPDPEPVLDERWSAARAFAATPVTLGASSLLLVGGVGGVAALAWRSGRDRRAVGSPVDVAFGDETGGTKRVPLLGRTETPVELVPPEGIRPGQVGTLVDEVAHPLDVTATIIDLAARGYLRIEEVEADGRRPDWRLHRLRESADLLGYERLVLDGLFDDDHPDEVRIGELEHRFGERLRQVQEALYVDVSERGWFHTRPDHERGRWLATGLAVAAVGVVATVLAAAFTSFGLVPVPVVLAGALLTGLSGRMPHRTAKGTGMLRRVEGFRRFIVESEAERARFAERRQLFSEYLPYAVVFGVTDRWARAFADLERGVPTPDWYAPATPGAFDTLLLASALDSFTVSTSGTITAVASSASTGASGFGGGGFSGGGIGGGGVGSW